MLLRNLILMASVWLVAVLLLPQAKAACTSELIESYKAKGLTEAEISKLCDDASTTASGQAVCVTQSLSCIIGSAPPGSSCYCNTPLAPIIGEVK